MGRFREPDWITDSVAIASYEGPFPPEASIIDVRWVIDHCAIPPEIFERVTSEINERSQNGRVVVHCIGGISRSPCFVAAWLCKRHGFNVDEALAGIKSKRPVISLHSDQEKSLREYIASRNTAAKS